MKWLTASVSLIFLLGVASAHADSHSSLPEPGTTPGSALFGLEQAQESISLALTFNSEKKAHKRLHMAAERLSEAEKLSSSNKSKQAEKAVRMHSKAMENAEGAIQKVPEDKRNNLSQGLNDTRNKSLSVLQDLKQKLPESAMKGINTAVQAHRQRTARNRSDASPGRPDQSQEEQSNRTGDALEPQTGRGPQKRETDSYVATGRVMKTSS